MRDPARVNPTVMSFLSRLFPVGAGRHFRSSLASWLGVSLFCFTHLSLGHAQDAASVLPQGVQAVWDLDKAFHESTPTRKRVCLNGLWQWQPAGTNADQLPHADWGYFKVPGCWPGITDYMQKDCQQVFTHPAWQQTKLGSVTAAWHQREFTVPVDWTGRRISLTAEYLNSFAVAFINGVRVGELHFPAGELDLTAACKPGQKYALSLFVQAMPLKAVLLSYTDSASARTVTGSVPRRGLCGDVFLVSSPVGPRVTDIRIATSVRKQELTLDVALDGLAPTEGYSVEARIFDRARAIKQLEPQTVHAAELKGGRFTYSRNWLPDRLWDTDTPENTYTLQMTLRDPAGRVLDTTWTERFGFREFWIDGRDFYLNGMRIFLSAVPLDNAQVSAGLATYEAARETFRRLLSFGINYVYTHNYDCEPGSHLSFTEILRAADDAGMLVGFTQPHFSHYEWRAPDAAQNNGYRRHAEFYVRAAQNHPAVVMYAMSHNATGYSEDMNPDLIDGVHDRRDTWAMRNLQNALAAEAMVKGLDPSRIVYHHASGNLSSMHVINFYPNWAPIQELSDWFEHWATEGVKPVFTCEYGAPFTWDWTMYRGWYKGKREFGSATVPWEFCLAEWNAQFYGDRAFQISEAEKRDLRWETDKFRNGRLWHRWDYPVEVGSSQFTERYPIFAAYLTDNWRAFRTWGVSATSPWEYAHFWKLRDGVDQRRRDLLVDWQSLQRPGFSPDYIGDRCQSMELAYERDDWIPTAAAQQCPPARLHRGQTNLLYEQGPQLRSR